MDELQLKRYCCRRMIMTHVDLIEKLLKYDSSDNFLTLSQTRPVLTTSTYRYTPDGRNDKKTALADQMG